MHLPLFFSKNIADKQLKRLKGKNSWKDEYKEQKLAEYKDIVICKIRKSDFFDLLNSSKTVKSTAKKGINSYL